MIQVLNSSMKRLNSGFTLIELMIAVAIIGILVAVGVPKYQNYVPRSQAVEGINLAGGIKTALAEYYNISGAFPKDTTDPHAGLGLEPATSITGKYVTSVTVSDDGLGTITAEFGSGNHAGKFIRLTAIAVASGSIYFDCDSDIEESYRPKECIEGTSGPTALEIAQAALVTAQDNLSVAQAAVTSYMADNNAALNTHPDGRPILPRRWARGLTPDERNLKAANYWRLLSLYYASKGNSSRAATALYRSNTRYLDRSGTLGTGYRDAVQVAADAAQAVTDAQQAVTDLGG